MGSFLGVVCPEAPASLHPVKKGSPSLHPAVTSRKYREGLNFGHGCVGLEVLDLDVYTALLMVDGILMYFDGRKSII